MKIIIAGPGCSRCQATEKNVFNAAAELNLDAEITKVSDVLEFAKLGVFLTPAVVVNGKVVVAGRIPTVRELKKLFSGI
jgi:small redox-active disulfide protein 2